jgi:hypothetical protein
VKLSSGEVAALKLDRFHALALTHGRWGCDSMIKYSNIDAIEYVSVPKKLRKAIHQVCRPEELGRWGGLAKFAYDYAFWYLAEEKKIHENHT